MAKILIVDPHPSSRSALASALGRAGHDADTAPDAQTALLGVRATRPALVVVELDLPFRDALETILEIRRIHAEARILAVAGSEMPNRGRCLRMAEYVGAHGALTRPRELPPLLERIDALLASGS